ncbi:MAG: polysaccharide deacetylase family protein [Syntrophomonadaceae bacterium]|nr:polysaccharide deacetylase family protein [Syntrophomonadaceae bacterium]
MKKIIPVSMIIIALGLMVWLGYTRMNAMPAPSGTPAQEEQTTIAPPEPHEPNRAEPPAPPRILDILGKSNRLTAQQWAAMQQWRAEVRQIALDNPAAVYINGNNVQPQVALTFDDGPDDAITPQVLELLNQYQVKATFFFKGNQVEKYPDIVNQAYKAGHLVASHAYSHQELNRMNRTDIDKEIVASDKAFRRVIGVAPAVIRPPFGAVNQDVLAVCRQENETPVLWSIDTLDWSQQEADNIVANVLNNVRPGDIILMHSVDGQEATVQALPSIITGLRAKGYVMVDVATLLNIPAYKN